MWQRMHCCCSCCWAGGYSRVPLDVLTGYVTEQYCSSFTQQCHNDGFVTLVDDQCSCLCPAGLDSSTGCTTTIKQGRWCVCFLDNLSVCLDPSIGSATILYQIRRSGLLFYIMSVCLSGSQHWTCHNTLTG